MAKPPRKPALQQAELQPSPSNRAGRIDASDHASRRVAAALEPANPTDTLPPLPRPPRPSEPKPARTEAKPSQGKTALYDSLEQEMASLLGRPTKT